jgi:thymidylate synthase
MAKHCGLEAEDFVYFLGNAHIYENHIEVLQKQILREPFPFPNIQVKTVHDNINDYEITDIEWLSEYKCHETLKMKMAA